MTIDFLYEKVDKNNFYMRRQLKVSVSCATSNIAAMESEDISQIRRTAGPLTAIGYFIMAALFRI